MSKKLESSVVRIRNEAGGTVGAGFLVDERLVVTCAHVIKSAIGLRDYPTELPRERISVDFPLIAPEEEFKASLIYWQPPQADDSGDVALLELAALPPAGTEPAILLQAEDLWGHPFRAFGFPTRLDNGVWASGRILGPEAAGWLQIEDVKQTGYFVQPGFSGGPVWDEQLEGVVGMTVAAEARTDIKTAFILPIAAIVRVYPELAKRVMVSGVAPAPGEPPYKGLQYFDVNDAEWFFGREALTAHLVGRLRGNRFLAVVGASGSGKSSLVRAGLVPALKCGERLADGTDPPEGSQRWPIHIITPGSHPLESLAASLTRDVESVTATATLIDDLRRDARSLHLYTRKKLSGHTQGAPHLLLVVDQFEELFTACRDLTERQDFVDNLLTAAGLSAPVVQSETWSGEEDIADTAGSTIVVITLRADFYHHCSQYEQLRAALEKCQAYIGPMNPEELRQAIENPARRGEWQFEAGLVDLMLRDAGDEPGALPLLSHALLETWRRRQGRIMTLADYADAGGVQSAIAQSADRVYRALTPERQAIARSIFLRLTELGEGTQDTRRRALLSELIPAPDKQPDVESMIKVLADARLVTTAEDFVEVSHEALIREWATLRDWLEDDREGLRIHRHLTETAEEWERMDRDQDELYRGVRLAQALEWAETHVADLNPLEREFLDASRDYEALLESEREARRQHELQLAKEKAEAERRSARKLRRRALYIAGVMVVALIAAVFALSFGIQAQNQKNVADIAQANAESAAIAAQANAELAATSKAGAEAASTQAIDQEATAVAESDFAATAQANAELQAERARAGELAAFAMNQLDQSLDLAFLLSVEAYTTVHTLQSQRALFQAWTYNPQLKGFFQGHTDTVDSVAWSGDGRLASGSADGTVILWDLESGQPAQTLQGHTNGITSVAWSGDGRLASGSEDGTVIVWDLESGQPAQTLQGHADTVLTVTWSGDGRLASGSWDNKIQVWEISPTVWVERVCQRAGRNLSQVEWNQYFPGEAYRKTCPQWPPGQ